MKFSIQVLLIFVAVSGLSGLAIADGSTPSVGQTQTGCSSGSQREVKNLPASGAQSSSDGVSVDSKTAK